MPPPPNPRMMMVDPRRWTANIPVVQPPCHCSNGAAKSVKSKSMEDVRDFVVEWEKDYNGNNVAPRVRGRLEARRSMENLLDSGGGGRKGSSPKEVRLRQRLPLPNGRSNGDVQFSIQVGGVLVLNSLWLSPELLWSYRVLKKHRNFISKFLKYYNSYKTLHNISTVLKFTKM